MAIGTLAALSVVLGTAIAQPAPDVSASSPDTTHSIRYMLERVEVEGNDYTSPSVVRRMVPLKRGAILDVDDPRVQAIRWRLLATGWFDEVRVRLRRGSRRGWVVLVVGVRERNTLLVRQVAMGISEGVQRTADRSAELNPYVGVTLEETNLLGLGKALSLTAVVSEPQQGARLRFEDPHFADTDYSFRVGALVNNARQFFGNNPLVSVTCPEPPPDDPDYVCPPEVAAKSAVVFYRRYALGVGTGYPIGTFSRLRLDLQGELVNVSLLPDAASEEFGDQVRPIDFAINDGVSFVSSVQLGLIHDHRDSPALPSRGVLAVLEGIYGTPLIGSDYEFLRVQGRIDRWILLPWAGHTVRLGAFGGVIVGRAPFFYKFHSSDLSDLIPSRMLQMNLDRRPPPNLLGTSIEIMRNEELAARVDAEYDIPLYRSDSALRAVNAYFGVGLYALTDPRNLRVRIPGYRGFSQIPLDLTFDLGIRADTDVGVFQVGFSNLLGFVTP